MGQEDAGEFRPINVAEIGGGSGVTGQVEPDSVAEVKGGVEAAEPNSVAEVNGGVSGLR